MIDKDFLKSKAAEIGIELSSESLDRFDKYAEMLVETNKTLNLTAITEPDEIVTKHFCDCLSLLKEVEIPQGAKLIDVGTGAGFPGVVLLIARPDLKITLMDSTNKRLVFVQSVVDALGLKANVVHSRAEEAGKNPAFREKYDFVTARAVANMQTLSEYCLPLLKVGGLFAAMKGAKASDELSVAKGAIKILGGQVHSAKEFNLFDCGERSILCVKKISQTPSKYPRPSAQIAKKPLA
ncbi:MAG: 16S rRNA (guanine(527)-N(7))-methyltransferase RsmG [Clostridia bacterium]|nr:16S rRNA (guanine(527)-N(7))-methyltransferase RsmG [Clostridia bacterium]